MPALPGSGGSGGGGPSTSFNPYRSEYTATRPRFDSAQTNRVPASEKPAAGVVSVGHSTAQALRHSTSPERRAKPHHHTQLSQYSQYSLPAAGSGSGGGGGSGGAAVGSAGGPLSAADYERLSARYGMGAETRTKKSTKKHTFDYDFTHQQLTAERVQIPSQPQSTAQPPVRFAAATEPTDAQPEFEAAAAADASPDLETLAADEQSVPVSASAAAAAPVRTASPVRSTHAHRKWSSLGGRETHGALHGWSDTAIAPVDQIDVPVHPMAGTTNQPTASVTRSVAPVCVHFSQSRHTLCSSLRRFCRLLFASEPV